MSAEQEIVDLDKALALDGEDIVLRRVRGTSAASPSNTEVTCRAFVRGFSPNELVNGITQQDSRVILSPTQIDDADWPGDDDNASVDKRVPRKNRGDRCVVGGRVHSVESAKGIWIDGILVRIDMTVRGVA